MKRKSGKPAAAHVPSPARFQTRAGGRRAPSPRQAAREALELQPAGRRNDPHERQGAPAADRLLSGASDLLAQTRAPRSQPVPPPPSSPEAVAGAPAWQQVAGDLEAQGEQEVRAPAAQTEAWPAGSARGALPRALAARNRVHEQTDADSQRSDAEVLRDFDAAFGGQYPLHEQLIQDSVVAHEPDALREREAPAGATAVSGGANQTDAPVAASPGSASVETTAPVAEPGAEAARAITVDLPPPPAPAPLEESATIAPLSLQGSSDQALCAAAAASPSQLARDAARLGGEISTKLRSERQAAMDAAPALQIELSGAVHEGLTPPGPLQASTLELQGEAPSAGSAAPQAAPHAFPAPPPSNAAQERSLDEEARHDGFFGWLRAHFDTLLRAIRTEDPNLNTRAGPSPRVRLDGDANPDQMAAQRQEGGAALRATRDELSAQLVKHPGQANIQTRALSETRAVRLQSPEPEPLDTPAPSEAVDYAAAELPPAVRARADAELGSLMAPRLGEAQRRSQAAGATRAREEQAELSAARQETERLNRRADAEQRQVVIDNRRSVAQQQRQGLTQAHAAVNDYEREAGAKQREQQRLIGEQIRRKEGEADQTLRQAEQDAEEKKQQEEARARAKKHELDAARQRQSWWERAKSAVKSAVSAITAAIDGIFSALREAVRALIDAAKQLAVAAINAARHFVVEQLKAFRDWAKDKVNRYLGSTFPGLAAAINRGIDATVDVAVAGVNMAADGAIAAVEAVAKRLAAALDRILGAFQTALKAAVRILAAVLSGDFVEALKIAIRAACEIAGLDAQPIFDFLARAGGRLAAILKRPVVFFNNLVGAVGLGARGFIANIRQHLIQGLIGWLSGALAETPITLPESFDARGIFSLAAQVLGLTYANIRARVIRRFPPAERVIGAVERGVEGVQLLITRGPIALWGMAREALGNLRERVMGAVRNYVIGSVVQQAVGWLLGLLNPAGALVQVLRLLFNLVLFLVQRFNQIRAFVLSIYNALSALASGAIAQAASAVENAMARSLPVLIGLLAALAGLGGIGRALQGVIRRVSAPINRVVDRVVERMVAFARRLLRRGREAAGRVRERLGQWWRARRRFRAVNGETHTLYFSGEERAAVLSIRSEPQPFQRFLNGLDEAGFNPEQLGHLTRARAIAGEIDAKRLERLAGSSEAQREASARAKQAELEALLQRLGEATRHLFGSNLPAWQEPRWAGLTAQGFGRSMEMQILSKRGARRGSPPSQAGHSVYDVLNLRRQAGGASFYIRGHLLNDNLGGPGQWYNMTPLSREGNHQHEAQVESYVKAGFDAGAALCYRVIPDYASRGDGESLKQALAARDPANAATFARIVDAEAQVPSRLNIRVARLVPQGEGFRQVEQRSWAPLNPIRRSPSDYFLAGGGKRLVPVDINALQSTAPLLAFQNHASGNLPGQVEAAIRAQAPAILAAVQRRRATGAPGFGTYAVLARETVAAGGSLTAEQASQWNQLGYILLR